MTHFELDYEPAGDDVAEVCRILRASAAEHPYGPGCVVELNTWLRRRTDEAYSQILACAVDCYRGDLHLVAHVLGLSLSGVYQACKRFGICHRSPMAGTVKARDNDPGGYTTALATGTDDQDAFFLDPPGSHKIYSDKHTCTTEESVWRRLNDRSVEILESLSRNRGRE